MSMQVQQRSEHYKGMKARDAGVKHMQRQGWRVVSETTEVPRSGCLRIVMLGGIGALIWRPKAIYTVTFAR